MYSIDESGLEPQPEQMAECALLAHRHGAAHSFSVSMSLSFFSREYAEAFMELCNSGTKGTEELGKGCAGR